MGLTIIKQALSLFVFVLEIVGLWITSLLLTQIGLGGVEGGKLISFVKMAANGLICVVVYFLITAYLKVPQSVFHIRFTGILNKLKRRGE